jgi:vacuolar-type H+-ATPase subunit I/STV1
VLRLPAKFVVTAKNSASTRDSTGAFWRHLVWALLLVGAISVAFGEGYANVDVLMWPALALLITLAPIVLSWLDAKPLASDGIEVPAPRAEVDLDPVTEILPGPETGTMPAQTDLESVA